MPSKSKPLKKLLHFYWEICPKTNPDGKLKQEMILVWYNSILLAMNLISIAMRFGTIFNIRMNMSVE
jgi:vesicle coat complex subunit